MKPHGCLTFLRKHARLHTGTFAGNHLTPSLCKPILRQWSSASSVVPATVVKSHSKGVLVTQERASVDTATSSSALRCGAIVEHAGRQWICAFAVDKYWFAAPLRPDAPVYRKWSEHNREESLFSAAEAAANQQHDVPHISMPSKVHGGKIATNDDHAVAMCLSTPTPVQSERVQLSEGLRTGLAVVDTLAPVGRGQSMLIWGAEGTGKSTLARDLLETALVSNSVDMVFRFGSNLSVPPADPAISKAGSFAEFIADVPSTVGLNNAESSADLLVPMFATIAAAERVRDAGGHSLVVLDTINPMLSAWHLAVHLAESSRGSCLDNSNASAQLRSYLAGVTERASNLASGGSMTLVALVDSEDIPCDKAADAHASSYSLADFEGRKDIELHRIRRMVDRRIMLTDATLSAVNIQPPSSGKTISSSTAPQVRNGVASSAMLRELQSLSDGQIVLDKKMALSGLFPSVVAGASFSRFGLGASRGDQAAVPQRDVRPAVLQPVAAHLRIELALEKETRFSPQPQSIDAKQSERMKCVKAALLQDVRAPLQPEEMAAMLLAACSGAFDGMSEEMVLRILRGGSHSLLVQHLNSAAPDVLQTMKENKQISKASAVQLNIAVRLFVELCNADVSLETIGATSCPAAVHSQTLPQQKSGM